MLGGEKSPDTGSQTGKVPWAVSEGWVGRNGVLEEASRKERRTWRSGAGFGGCGQHGASWSETPGAPRLEWGGQWSRGR